MVSGEQLAVRLELLQARSILYASSTEGYSAAPIAGYAAGPMDEASGSSTQSRPTPAELARSLENDLRSAFDDGLGDVEPMLDFDPKLPRGDREQGVGR